MKGAIIGDIIGSRFEFNNTNSTEFNLFTKSCSFTDDTICTIATMEALTSGGMDFKNSMLKWCRKYPHPMGGYGASFAMWVRSDNPQPYNSFGNGAAMRVSPCAWAFERRRDAERAAAYNAGVTHNHPEGIIGAVAVVDAIVRLRYFKDKWHASWVEKLYYDPTLKYERGVFNETCQGTVPVALRIIVQSDSFEDAIRKAIAWGGDSDTIGAIVGGMAEALYGVPEDIWDKAKDYLPNEMLEVVDNFYVRYGINNYTQ